MRKHTDSDLTTQVQVPKWQDQLQAAYPKSASEHWPADLIGSYMSQEIRDYRDLAATPVKVPTKDSGNYSDLVSDGGMDPRNAPQATVFKPCPICNAEMADYGDEFEHPENDCIFSEWNFACDANAWNRRASATAQVDMSDLKIDAISEAYQARVKQTYEYDPAGYWRGFAREVLASNGSK